MLENKSRQPSDESASSAIAQPLPDPWESPSPTVAAGTVLDEWKFPTEPHPLIQTTDSSEVLLLPAPTLNPIQILLQDELKLKAWKEEKLASGINQALALLGWMGTVQGFEI
jgi:hypothetical protein